MDEQAKQFFLSERDIPYSVPLDNKQVDNCCLGKSQRLRKKLESIGYEVRDRICWFRWSDLPLPESVRAVPHEDTSTHLYLEVKINSEWRVVDATWDPELASIFTINKWDETKDMTVAVPCYETLSPEASKEYMKNLGKDESVSREDSAVFSRVVNEWFKSVRSV